MKRLIRKHCSECDKVFFTKSEKRKYCSKECKRKAIIANLIKYEQPCWHCKNCSDECCWIKSGKPVDDWVADPSVLKDGFGNTYNTFKIISCPNYICEI